MAKYEYVSWDDFYPKPLPKYNLFHKKGTPKRTLAKDYMCLDTETSHNGEVGWIYQWAFSYPKPDGNRLIVYGRKPSELREVLHRIKVINGLDENNKLVCFIHNASYDYTYFHNWLTDEYHTMGSLLAIGSHRIISWNIEGLEFRDSLKIAMKSLAKWGEDLGIAHGKLVGAIDYGIKRYQDTKLGRKDWLYMWRDVISLDECISKQLELFGDTIQTMPLTNTGYVRRETRKEFKKEKSNRTYFKSKALTTELYQLCRHEFAGGLTHGNRFYIGMTVRGTIRHRDFASHYPSQQICGYCPAGKYALYHTYSPDRPPLTVNQLMSLTEFSFIALITISNLTIREGVTIPYAQYSKFYEGKGASKLDCVLDNGRILKMLEGHSTVAVNEYDLKWLIKQYTFDYRIEKVYTSVKAEYPDYITNTVNKYFYQKTLYKNEVKHLIKEGYPEDSPEVRDAKQRLMIAKQMLNSIYGMTATSPVRESFTELEDGTWERELLTVDAIAEKLEKFYKNKNNFMSYEFGLSTTASARDELLEFTELIGYENVLYCDTDSLFYLSTPEIEARIDAKNEELRKIDDEKGWYIEIEGKRTYYNQFELEDEDIREFRFLHSKCYAYVTADGKLHTTIAGVREYSGKTSRVGELGDIENLLPGKVFRACGGTTISYPGEGCEIKPREVVIDGHITEVSSYAIISRTTKTLHSAGICNEDMLLWEQADSQEV